MRKVLVLLAALPAAGCFSADGHFDLLGYTTRPNYDTSIRTVYVPVFRNEVFQTTPYRGLEFLLTQAVIREIEARTPYKVVSDPLAADTELRGVVVTLLKNLLNVNQENEVRQFELLLGADLTWYDNRAGRYLTNPIPPDRDAPPPFDPTVPQIPTYGPDRPIPVRVHGRGRAIPELGESSTSALNLAVDELAVQIATMMEKPW